MYITYTLTSETLEAEYIATGIRNVGVRTLKIDSTTLTPEQRTIVAKLPDFFSTTIRHYEVKPASISLFHTVIKPEVKSTNWYLSAAPTVDEAVELLAQMQIERAAADAQLSVEMEHYRELVEQNIRESAIEAEQEAITKAEKEAQHKAERAAKAILPWSDDKAVCNLYQAIFAVSDLDRDGRDGFAAWVKEITAIDPAQPNGYSLVGGWINNQTMEITRGTKRIYLVANQTGSRKNRTTDYVIVAMDEAGALSLTDIATDDTDRGWALRIRAQVAALLA